MLTKELAIFDLDRDRLLPERLTRRRHGHYLGYAREMLGIYAKGLGCTRRELHARVKAVFRDEPDCPPQRIEAFCKLLDETRVAQYRDRPLWPGRRPAPEGLHPGRADAPAGRGPRQALRACRDGG